MKYRHVLKRRTFLKAGGAISIGLPFLDCMTEKSAFGQPLEPPVSVISLLHGLGTPDIILDRGIEGTIRYYKPFIDANKLSLFTNIDMTAANPADPVGAQHHNGQPYLFSGWKTELTAGFNVVPQGPSMQYSILKQHYQQGLPTQFRLVDCGIYFRRAINYQRERIYDDNGNNAADFADLASPLDMFDKLFGTVPDLPDMDDPKARASRSILDYLIPQLEALTGAGSNLPPRDIAVLNNHLDRVRQLETDVYGSGGKPGKIATLMRPTPPDINYTVDGAGEGEAHQVNAADFETAYQIMADIFVAGLESDYFRFGNLSFEAGGGHTSLQGPAPNPDDPAFTFDGNPHANYHAWDPGNANCVKIATGHNFFVHKNIAQVLSKLDSLEFAGPNGKSLLENMLVLIGSEVGTNHDVSRMLHGVAGGAGRFKMGTLSDDRIKAIELYNAIGKSYDMTSVGDGVDYNTDATVILA